MFDRASKTRIPTTVSFYLLTLLLSTVLLSLLRVNTRNFYFGVATCLLAHAAVYLLTRERVPAWAALFILALLVPLFPPEALTPIERGALYWGILAGLLSYMLTYGAHYCLSRNREETGKEAQNGPRAKLDRHTSELFQLLNVTSLSQAVRTARKLLQERDRQQSDTASAAKVTGNSEVAVLQGKLKETQNQLKRLRKKLEGAKQPRDTEFRQMQDRLEDTQRKMKEAVTARERAVERAQSMEGFQLKVAELTQQMNALRNETRDGQPLVEQLRRRVSAAESARDAARSDCQRLEGELARRNAQAKEANTSCDTASAAKEFLEHELSELTQRAQAAETRSHELTVKLHSSEKVLAAARHAQQDLKCQLDRLQSQVETHPRELEEVQAQIASLDMEKHRAGAEIGCLGSRLREKTREIERGSKRIGELDQTTEKHEKELEDARKKIAALEDSVSFYLRTLDDLTPEVDRLDGIISRYEAAYGPPPKV